MLFKVLPHLTKPNVGYLVPKVLLVGIYAILGESVQIGAVTVPGLAIAIWVHLVAILTFNITRLHLRGRRILPIWPLPILLAIGVVSAGIAALGCLAPSAVYVQIGWTVTKTFFAVVFAASYLSLEEAEKKWMPSRWALYRNSEVRDLGLAYDTVRIIVDAVLLAVLIPFASVEVWIAFIAVGQIVTYYVAQALVLHRLMTRTKA